LMLIYIQLEWLCVDFPIDLSSGKQPIKKWWRSIVIVLMVKSTTISSSK
jgi:hypothetical protein